MTINRFDDFLAGVRRGVIEISATEAHTLLLQGVLFFDVREENEFELETIVGALTPGRSFLEMRVSEQVRDANDHIVLYCASGVRSVLAAASLKALGYSRVMSLGGGLAAWKAAAFPTATPKILSNDERKRYSRQMILPEVGGTGQQKLKQSKVLVLGAGGLGSPCLLYLAAAGVGRLGVVDHDVVDLSNLQRQIIYATADVGQSKTAVAKNVLTRMNPNLIVDEFHEKFDFSNAANIAKEYDILVDCTDNFSARYLINDTALALNIPVVHGSVFQFEGRVALLNSEGGACYRCVYAEAPPKDISPSCSEAGVLGIVPGLIGVMQATIAIKWILGLASESSSALIYNCLDGVFLRRKLRKRPDCVCNPHSPLLCMN